jgi:hypothetical protein
MAAAGAAVEPVPEPTVTDERAVEAEPPTEEAAPEPSPTPAAPPSSQEATTTRSDGWPSASDTVDLTVTVTDRNRPLVGLQANAFRIRVGGRETPIVRIGDAATAPLNLGFVVALSPMTGELRSEVSRQAARFSLRIAEDRGDAFVTSSTGFSGWGMDANELAAAIADVPVEEELNVAALMAQASEAFSTRRGRSFLVIISDGSDVATKAQWKEASSAAAEAGVPIYVIGLRDSGFSSRARTSLGRTADVTGGRKYFLADPGMLEMTLDFIGELVDASYAIQINRSGASSGDNVKITGADKSWQVDHPGQLP